MYFCSYLNFYKSDSFLNEKNLKYSNFYPYHGGFAVGLMCSPWLTQPSSKTITVLLQLKHWYMKPRFEGVMLLLILNFIGNISRYRLWKREKWLFLVFHLSFILIFIGGAITRYISYEGIIISCEGETSNEVTWIKIFKNSDRGKGWYSELSGCSLPHVAASQKLQSKLRLPRQAGFCKSGWFYSEKKDSLIAGNTVTEYLHVVSTGQSGRENILY